MKNTFHEALTTGAILVCSYGYDVSFEKYYKVMRRVGKTQVELQELGQWQKLPCLHRDIGESFKRKIRGSSIKIHDGLHAFPYPGNVINEKGNILNKKGDLICKAC